MVQGGRSRLWWMLTALVVVVALSAGGAVFAVTQAQNQSGRAAAQALHDEVFSQVETALDEVAVRTTTRDAAVAESAGLAQDGSTIASTLDGLVDAGLIADFEASRGTLATASHAVLAAEQLADPPTLDPASDTEAITRRAAELGEQLSAVNARVVALVGQTEGVTSGVNRFRGALGAVLAALPAAAQTEIDQNANAEQSAVDSVRGATDAVSAAAPNPGAVPSLVAVTAALAEYRVAVLALRESHVAETERQETAARDDHRDRDAGSGGEDGSGDEFIPLPQRPIQFCYTLKDPVTGAPLPEVCSTVNP